LTSAAAPVPGSGTVLVVEDDPDVRDLVLALLDDLEYTTLAAGSGPEAIRILEAPDLRIDLMLTDIVMPGGMTGLELVSAARALRPGLPVVLTSGYRAGNMAADQTGKDNPLATLPVLSKPYQQDELARIIEQALHSA
jgi:CheY-like chemotaxis protein